VAWLDVVRATSPRLVDVFLVHGEAEAQDAFAAQLAQHGVTAQAPRHGLQVTR